jgi:hypothetical protein
MILEFITVVSWNFIFNKVKVNKNAFLKIIGKINFLLEIDLPNIGTKVRLNLAETNSPNTNYGLTSNTRVLHA